MACCKRGLLAPGIAHCSCILMCKIESKIASGIMGECVLGMEAKVQEDVSVFPCFE